DVIIRPHSPGTSYERSPSASTVNVPTEQSSGANPLIPIREKAAAWWPIFCSTNSYVFLLFKGSLEMHSCPRSAGAVRNRTVLLWVGRPLEVCIEIGRASCGKEGR